MEHIEQAIHGTVHESDVSTKNIAARMGMSYQVLINKANPQCETHKMTLLESVALQIVTGSTRIADAVTTELSIQIKKDEEPTSILQATLNAVKEGGDVVSSIHKSLEDGRFTLREKENCQREINENIEALTKLSQAIVGHGEATSIRSVV